MEEWYVKDASGNTIATYKKDAALNSGRLTATEFYKYGSSLLSIKSRAVDMTIATNNTNILVRGEDGYILSDYRQNTFAVISDKRIAVQNPSIPAQILYYIADVKTADYYSAYGAISKSYGAAPVVAFNGQRKSLEIGANAQTAEFWEYNGDIGRRGNLDPKPNIHASPFNCFMGNPILNSDINGDSVILRNLYDKDKNGNYLHSNAIFAFEMFAKTKEGEKYILNHAEAGFKLKGIYVNDLNIEAKNEGKNSSKGVDINLKVVPHGSIPNGQAETGPYTVENGRLKQLFSVEQNDKFEHSTDFQERRDKMLERVDDWSHEFFLHGDLQVKKFLDNSSLKWDSHLEKSWIASKFGGEKKAIFSNSSAIKVLDQAQNLKIVLNQNLKPHSLNWLYYKIMMKGLGYTTLDFYDKIPEY